MIFSIAKIIHLGILRIIILAKIIIQNTQNDVEVLNKINEKKLSQVLPTLSTFVSKKVCLLEDFEYFCASFNP